MYWNGQGGVGLGKYSKQLNKLNSLYNIYLTLSVKDFIFLMYKNLCILLMLNGKNTNTDRQLNDFCGVQVSEFFPNTKISHSIHMEMLKCLGMFSITN